MVADYAQFVSADLRCNRMIREESYESAHGNGIRRVKCLRYGMRCSALSVRCSLFGVQRSRFGVCRLAFAVQRLSFSIRCRAFTIQRLSLSVGGSVFAGLFPVSEFCRMCRHVLTGICCSGRIFQIADSDCRFRFRLQIQISDFRFQIQISDFRSYCRLQNQTV